MAIDARCWPRCPARSTWTRWRTTRRSYTSLTTRARSGRPLARGTHAHMRHAHEQVGFFEWYSMAIPIFCPSLRLLERRPTGRLPYGTQGCLRFQPLTALRDTCADGMRPPFRFAGSGRRSADAAASYRSTPARSVCLDPGPLINRFCQSGLALSQGLHEPARALSQSRSGLSAPVASFSNSSGPGARPSPMTVGRLARRRPAP